MVSQSDRALEILAKPGEECWDRELIKELLGQPTVEKEHQGGAVWKEAAEAVQGATHHCN